MIAFIGRIVPNTDFHHLVMTIRWRSIVDSTSNLKTHLKKISEVVKEVDEDRQWHFFYCVFEWL